MITLGTSHNLNKLSEFIKNQTDFYIFNYDKCEIEMYRLKSFNFELENNKNIIKLVFMNLGNEDVQHTLHEEGSFASAGLPDTLVLYESKQECITSLDNNFIERVMAVGPNGTKNQVVGLNTIALYYKFKQTTLLDWIEQYPQILL